MKKNRLYNTEHLVPVSQKGSNHYLNKKRSTVKEHSGKHDYLGTRIFHEQILKILDDNYRTLLPETRDAFKHDIISIIELYMNGKQLYNPKCFLPNKVPKK